MLFRSVTLDLLAIQDDPNGSQNGKMVTLMDSADSLNFVGFGVFSGDTVVGTYDLASSRTLEPSTSVLGTVLMRADNETTAAMNVTESQYASIYGATPPTYGYITNGSLEITENSGVYTIVWSFTTNGGEAITGTYEGEIDFSS